TGLFDAVCGRCCANRTSSREWAIALTTISAGPTPSSQRQACLLSIQPTSVRDTPDEENYRLESRVRENRTHGSEGGDGIGPFPTPIGNSGKSRRIRRLHSLIRPTCLNETLH